MASYLQKLIHETENTPEFITEAAMLAFTEQIVKAMDATGLNRSELARRAGLDPAQITRILRGDHNVTARTMGRLVAALGGRLSIAIHPAKSAQLVHRKPANFHQAAANSSVQRKPRARRTS